MNDHPLCLDEPPPVLVVNNQNKNKTFIFELHKGNTRDILKDQSAWFDMALIGGGNSIKTVAHDYDCVKQSPIVMLDHYFREDDDKMAPNDAYCGVNKVWEKLKGNKNIGYVVPLSFDIQTATHKSLILNENISPYKTSTVLRCEFITPIFLDNLDNQNLYLKKPLITKINNLSNF